MLDALGPETVPGPPKAPSSPSGKPLRVLAPLQVATAPHGLIAIAGSDPAEHRRGVLIQGRSGHSFARLQAAVGLSPAGALSTAYLGDLGLLASSPSSTSGSLAVEIERWFAHRGARRALLSGRQTVGALPLALAMDYRSDALAVWSVRGELYVRDLPSSGVAHRSQRLGRVGEHPHVAALLSDDNRAMVLWALSSGAGTRIYFDYSAPGVRFGTPQLIESYADPGGLPAPDGSPRLIRLSSESVMAAWDGAAAGHWVLRTAPIDQRGMQSVSTITAPGGDALLSALAPGPYDEAIVLWTEPQLSASGHLDLGHQSILAARGTETAPGTTRFGPAELIASPGPVAGATVAVDPASGRALAAWRGEHGSIHWSVRSSPPPG